MRKKKIRFIIFIVSIMAVGTIVAIALQKKENKDYDKVLMRKSCERLILNRQIKR